MNKKERKKIIKDVTITMIAMLHKESQVSRSISSSCNKNKVKFKELNKKYKKELYKLLKKLMDKADNSSIKNEEIRDSIKKLSKNTGVSIGQAQKVINVVLKYYCIISGKKDKVLRELDCPLDNILMSSIKKKIKKKELNVMKLKDLDLKNYQIWQCYLEKTDENSLRISSDIKIYDKNRIKEWLK